MADEPSASVATADTDQGSSRPNPWPIALAVILPTFMEVLDTSIAAVALPHIAGSLSSTTDEATWVLTSYLIANAVVLPTSGWFTLRFGRRRFLIACIVLFTIASFACGAATSLPMILIARAFQGAGGGALQPLSQSILLESFSPAQRGYALGLYGLGVVTAPVIGPVAGGWLTDNFSWRWAFYINIPVGVVAIFMVFLFVHDPAYIKKTKAGRLDAIGFGLLAIWLACMQVVLDKGQEDDWLASTMIRALLVIFVVSFVLFLVRELLTDAPVVDLRVFENRNFAVGCLLMALFGAGVYAVTSALPLFFQTLLGYTATAGGFASAPRGLGAAACMPLVGIVVTRLDNRWLIAAGFGLFGFGSLLLGGVSLGMGEYSMFWPIVATGFAAGLVFIPLTNVAMGTLSAAEGNQASGIFNLLRNVGGSVGISAVQTLVLRRQQTHQSQMVGALSPLHEPYRQSIQTYQHLLSNHVGHANATQPAYELLYHSLGSQATLWAYVDTFRWMAMLCFCCIPLAFLVRKVAAKPGAGGH
jgi:DHA2 family multidrug resistance protein